MPSVQSETPHPALTARRSLTYVFTPKHHGFDKEASRWAEISLAMEFAIFDRADGVVVPLPVDDNRQVADEDGNLYGCEPTVGSSLLELGTWYQQIAEFPFQKDGMVWHGYPAWPILSESAPPWMKGERCRPDVKVFHRMLQLGIINRQQKKKLCRGDRA